MPFLHSRFYIAFISRIDTKRTLRNSNLEKETEMSKIMYPKPPPPEDVFDGLLHGTSERPLLVSIQPFSPSNFKALVRVGFASYWFAPRSDAKFIDRPKTTKRPESSEAAFIDGSTNDESTAPSFNFGGSQTNNSSKSTGSSLFGGNQTQSSSNATENQKMLRLRCTNKNCKAKLVLYCSNTDKYDSMFFQQNFEVSEKSFPTDFFF